MANNITIREVSVCDSDRQELYYNNNTEAYLVGFRPRPWGKTEKILLRVVCSVDSGTKANVDFTLKLLGPDYEFLLEDGEDLDDEGRLWYNTDVYDEVAVYLVLCLKNTIEPNRILNAQFLLTAGDRGSKLYEHSEFNFNIEAMFS